MIGIPGCKTLIIPISFLTVQLDKPSEINIYPYPHRQKAPECVNYITLLQDLIIRMACQPLTFIQNFSIVY